MMDATSTADTAATTPAAASAKKEQPPPSAAASANKELPSPPIHLMETELKNYPEKYIKDQVAKSSSSSSRSSSSFKASALGRWLRCVNRQTAYDPHLFAFAEGTSRVYSLTLINTCSLPQPDRDSWLKELAQLPGVERVVNEQSGAIVVRRLLPAGCIELAYGAAAAARVGAGVSARLAEEAEARASAVERHFSTAAQQSSDLIQLTKHSAAAMELTEGVREKARQAERLLCPVLLHTEVAGEAAAEAVLQAAMSGWADISKSHSSSSACLQDAFDKSQRARHARGKTEGWRTPPLIPALPSVETIERVCDRQYSRPTGPSFGKKSDKRHDVYWQLVYRHQTLLKVATAVAQGAASSAASSAADANAAASIAEAMAADAWQFFNNVDDSSVLRDSSSASVGSSLTKGAISIPAPPATAPYNCLKMSCSSSIGELRPSLRTTVQDRAIGKQELGPRPLSALSATPKPVVPARPSPDVATQGGVLKNPGSKQRSWQEVMFEKMEGVLRGAVEAVRKVPKYFKEKRSAYQLQEWERQCAKSAAPT